jgi:hypothetical protein
MFQISIAILQLLERYRFMIYVFVARVLNTATCGSFQILGLVLNLNEIGKNEFPDLELLPFSVHESK